MKKIFLIASLSVAGLASANDLTVNPVKSTVKVENSDSSDSSESAKKMLCTSITIQIMCDSSQNFNNSYCWTEGSQESFQAALHCYEQEYTAFNNEICN
jgi:hypothetical protein